MYSPCLWMSVSVLHRQNRRKRCHAWLGKSQRPCRYSPKMCTHGWRGKHVVFCSYVKCPMEGVLVRCSHSDRSRGAIHSARFPRPDIVDGCVNPMRKFLVCPWSRTLKNHNEKAPQWRRPLRGLGFSWWPGTESNRRHGDFQSWPLKSLIVMEDSLVE